MEIKETVRLEPPRLVTVTVPVTVVPTVLVAQFRFVGVTLICGGVGIAVPVRATCPAETPEFVWSVKFPLALPPEVGLNQTWKVAD